MSKYGYEVFEDEHVEEIMQNMRYGFYEVFDCKYGDYDLQILKENNNIIIHLQDEYGESSHFGDVDHFVNVLLCGGLEKYIDRVLYYNYQSYEEL